MITVVIPAYNSAETIVEALDSVVGQDLTTEYTEHTEIIVVDDCSTDDTCEVVKKWGREFEQEVTEGAEKNLKLRLIEFKENGGPARARNVGIQAAKGDWIAFLDADDAWLPDRLAVQMRVLEENPDAVMICGGTIVLTTESTEDTERKGGLTDSHSPSVNSVCSVVEKLHIPLASRELKLIEFVDLNPVSTSTVLVRKDVLEEVGGFDEQFRGPEDLDLWIRIAKVGKILQVRRPLSRYREVAGSLSNEVSSFLPQVIAVYDKAFADGGALCRHPEWKPRAIGSRYVSACWTELACGRRVNALKFLGMSVVVWPWRLGGEKRRVGWRWILLAKIILNKA